MGEKLPPTRGTPVRHIKRLNYICTRAKSYHEPNTTPPEIESNGWELVENQLMMVRCLNIPAPAAVLELIKCRCKVRSGEGACSA